MSNPFETMGIKEVADVTFYDTVTGVPVLYLDTLKVSTMETTAQQVAATGGKGNSPLVIWDFGKEITVTLEDALFSMKSMAMMNGGKMGKQAQVDRATSFTPTTTGQIPDGKEIPSTAKYYDSHGTEVQLGAVQAGMTYIASWQDTVAGGADMITISAESFPGTYKVVGLTYARNTDGVDEFFQFVIPRAKMGSENTITMQAEGDPSTFTMTMRVMRPQDGNMVKLLKFPKTDSAAVVDVTGVTLDQTTLGLQVGGTAQLAATVMPADATTKDVIWSSSNESIATVTPTGLVNAIANGTANITVTTVDGGFSAVCAVSVGSAIIPVTGVTLDTDTVTLSVGADQTLLATIAPTDASNKSVTWASDDDLVATVNSQGTVTAVAAGTAEITVTTVDGGFTDTATVTVS